MRFEKKFLRSKVARRMLAFFVLSAFIPVSFLAFLSYWESNRFLVKQAHARLDSISAIYKASIYDRLLLLEETVKGVSLRLSEEKLSTSLETQLSEKIRSLVLRLPSNDTLTLLGSEIEEIPLNAHALEHLYSGKPLLLAQHNSPDIKIYILWAQNPSIHENGILIAEIIPEYLWGEPDTFILDTNLCVYNEDYTNIFCTNSSIDPLIQKNKENMRAIKGNFTFQDDVEKSIASYHEIFLQPKFFTSRWLVVATQSETEALDSSQKFNTIFWSSVFLSVLLILLFSMTQIRRVLVPLEQLIDGTRRLGNHDFRTKVDVTSSDEFGELALSFNTMSEKLGDQFETLAALSKIDHEILSALNIEEIAKDVLIHLQKITNAHFTSISVIHNDSKKEMHVYMIDGNSKQLHSHPHVLSDSLRELLAHNPRGIWIDNELIRQQIQIGNINMVAPQLFLLPLNWKDQMVGFISLGFSTVNQWKTDKIKHIRDYADRLAVALFTKDREELLIRQARIDVLTGLPNRFLFVEQLQKEIAHTRREEEKGYVTIKC